MTFVFDDQSDWVEIPRLEALQRLENMLTVDIVGFDIAVEEIPSPLGLLKTFTFIFSDENTSKDVLLCFKEADSTKPPRWFLHKSLQDYDSPI